MQPAPEPETTIPEFSRLKAENPAAYIPDEGLADAITAASVLQKPLLVTGEPGTGKTQLAAYIAWWLTQQAPGGPVQGPLVFEAKSTSVARDLFYTYDVIGRFQARQLGIGSTDPVDYLHYNALGAAIMNSRSRPEILHCLPPTFVHNGPCRSVVLIDEIDKAPRDFPNDLLNEIENLYFTVTELQGKVLFAAQHLKPFIVLTSNSEKSLPAPFLRRCVYYHIDYPSPEKLMEIVCARLTDLAVYKEPFLKSAIDLFKVLRAPEARLDRPPATAELLDWLNFARLIRVDFTIPLHKRQPLLEKTLSILIKKKEDKLPAMEVIRVWSKR